MDLQRDLFGNGVPQLKQLDRDFLEQAVFEIFRDISFDDFVGMIVNEVDECVEYYRLSRGENSCQKTSLLFNPHRLKTKTRNDSRSMFSALKDESFLKGLSRAIAFQYRDSNSSTKDLLYRTLRFGINGVGYANEFPPKVARDLCIEYGVTRQSRVLDPCAGWGGRMLGTSVVTDCYECFEPSTETYIGLLRLSNWICRFSKDFRSVIHHLPFEDSSLEPESYDFALTSPPYYDTEDYSDEETNSKNRYGTFEEWCDGFYIPMIRKTMDALKSGSVFVLNIGSRIYPLNEVLMSAFGDTYDIHRHKDMLGGNGGGLKNSSKEGEAFYVIRKP